MQLLRTIMVTRLGIPPSGTGKKITVDPITGSEIFILTASDSRPRTAGYQILNLIILIYLYFLGLVYLQMLFRMVLQN